MTAPYVLVVEDEEDHRSTLLDLLELEGYRAIGVEHGAAALDWLRVHPPPALILLDIMMPVMNGWAFRAAQLQDPGLASIQTAALTASRIPDDELSPLGFCAVLHKPPDLPRLVALVRLHLRGEADSIAD